MSIRVERVRGKVKFEVARILQTELNDPRMGFVTVVGCDLSADFRYAKIKVSILSDEQADINRIMGMLEDATGYVQRIVAGRLRTRVTPKLTFELDRGVEKSIEVSSLLDTLREEREAREALEAQNADPDAEEGEADSDPADDSDPS